MAQIKVLSPTSGDIKRVGDYLVIKWISSGTTNRATISLYESTTSTLIKTIDSSANMEDRLYIWKIPFDLDERADYFIRVSELSSSTTDDGDDFSIKEAFTLSDFTNFLSLKKIILIEWKTGIVLDDTFTITGSGNDSYYMSYAIEKELVDCEYNGESLQRVFSTTECESLSNSFYHDYLNDRVYVNLDGDDPNGSGNFVMGYVWLCITNTQESEFKVDFIPQNSLLPQYYDPWLDASAIPPIVQKVAEYYTSALTRQFGNLAFLQDGWFWSNRYIYEWHNKDIYVKVGEQGNTYEDFALVYVGITKNPSWTDKKFSIKLKDKRTSDLRSVPESRYNTTDYPSVDEDFVNKEVAVLFGTKTGIRAIYIGHDSNGYNYKVSNTVFNGTTYALESIDKVYQAGVRIYVTDNYTENLNTGVISLVEDAGDDVITVDAQGIKCQYDFTGTGSGITYKGEATGVFSENVADILFFTLTELNKIPLDRIDIDSFYDLQQKRTQRLGWYLCKATKTMEFVRLLQRSAIFHFLPNVNGTYAVKYYDRAISTDSLHHFDEDFSSFEISENTASAFKTIVLEYDKHPNEDIWKYKYGNNDSTEYKYREEETLKIQTALTNDSEAETVLDFYQDLTDAPVEKLSAEVSPEALQSIPTDKAYFTRSIVDDRSNTVNIVSSEVYQIIEVRKDITKGKVSLVGLLDTQVGGQGSHADVAHEDSHTDTSHSDYTDVAHSDTAYSDSYSDVAHTDTPYVDSHSDITYADSYSDYSDVGHLDLHADIPHSDSYTDVAYGDVSHSDSHSDVAHADGHTDSHSNTHADEHADIPHTDSEV